MFGLGAGELLIVLVFALVFIGPKKLPELARGLGKGLREFQKAKDDLMNHVNDPNYVGDDSGHKIDQPTAQEPHQASEELFDYAEQTEHGQKQSDEKADVQAPSTVEKKG